MKNRFMFYTSVSLITLILIIGVSLSFFKTDFTGQAIFVKSSITTIKSSVNAISCNDSDKGINFDKRGIVTTNYFFRSPNSLLKRKVVTKKFSDYCVDNNLLAEYYCKNKNVLNVTRFCTYGCIDGACNSVPQYQLINENSVLKKSENIKASNGQTAIYDIYYIPQTSFEVVCQQPCPISESILKKKTVGAYYAIDKLIKLTGIDILDINKPVEIHLNSDIQCGDYNQIATNDPNHYVYRFAGSKPPPGQNGSYVCLWENDDNNIILPLNEQNAGRIQAQLVLVHEYGHILFYDRSFVSPEDFVNFFSYYVSGVWDGNGLQDSNFRFVNTLCDNSLYSTLSNACLRCDFDVSKVKPLMITINNIFQAKQGREEGCRVSTPQFKSIVDDLVKPKDSVVDCGIDWLADLGNIKNLDDNLCNRNSGELTRIP